MRSYDADAVAALGPDAAREAIIAALVSAVDPAADTPRTSVELAKGHFLLMPSQGPTAAGVKVASVAPGNSERGLPRIQAVYVLFDGDTLAPRAVLDGTALTTLRTPAVSVAATIARLREEPLHLAVIGAGPQAHGHVAALGAARRLASTTFLVRRPRSPGDVALGSPSGTTALERADVIVCATSARTPLFDSRVVRDDAVVIAVGSHEPDARELDSALLGRATTVVEDVATALREAGDVVLAVADGALGPDDLVSMKDVVTGVVRPPADRPLAFKSVGMAWEDLAVATAVVERS